MWCKNSIQQYNRLHVSLFFEMCKYNVAANRDCNCYSYYLNNILAGSALTYPMNVQLLVLVYRAEHTHRVHIVSTIQHIQQSQLLTRWLTLRQDSWGEINTSKSLGRGLSLGKTQASHACSGLSVSEASGCNCALKVTMKMHFRVSYFSNVLFFLLEFGT